MPICKVGLTGLSEQFWQESLTDVISN